MAQIKPKDGNYKVFFIKTFFFINYKSYLGRDSWQCFSRVNLNTKMNTQRKPFTENLVNIVRDIDNLSQCIGCSLLRNPIQLPISNKSLPI